MKTDTKTQIAITVDRRQTLGLLLAASLLPALPGCSGASANPAAQTLTDVQPSLTRTAVIHDALLLLLSDADVTGEFQTAIAPLAAGKPFELSYAYGAASLGSDPRPIIDIVNEVRTGWESREDAFMDIQRHKKGMMDRHVLVAIGSAANIGASRSLFPAQTDHSDVSLAMDGALIRSLAGGRVTAQEVERVIQTLIQRAFVAMHTIEPDLDDLMVYIDRYARWIDDLPLKAQALADAAAAPAPRSLPPDFIKTDDPVIQAARGFRIGLVPSGTARDWAKTPARSHYGRAVKDAYDRASAVLNAMQDRSDLAKLERLLSA